MARKRTVKTRSAKTRSAKTRSAKTRSAKTRSARGARRVEQVLQTFPVAEAPPPQKLRFTATGANFGEAAQGVDPEPVFDEAARDQIQGNIIPGFRKDHQHFLFFKLGRKADAKRWLRWIAPQITPMDDALAFVRSYRALRDRLGSKDVPLKATWINIAFSYGAIAALVSPQDADAFGDQSFRQGLAERSGFLGDPTSRKVAGNRHRWVVGGPGKEADILVIIAADDPLELKVVLRKVKASARTAGLKLLFEQRGEALPGPLRGHEHFGFKDGVSQPGIRGRVSTAPTDFITPRYLDPSDDRAKLFARPGQPLIWPGEFLLGEQRQHTENLYTPAAASDKFPTWAARGSYLVCRRLRQDVRAFWTFATEQAAAVGLLPEKFASMLMGRWPSGAPVMRTPGADIPALAADDLANNHFLFDDDTRPSALIPIAGYPGDLHPQAAADVLGRVCPHFAHIRKVNPRDSVTDLGKTGDTLLRTVLRRGIAFGPPVIAVKRPSAKLSKQERGLMFVCYQASIEDQFEFLVRRWSNSSLQPNLGGHDPVIGQHESYGNRQRFIEFPNEGSPVRIPIHTEWVIPTGGGYFFAPPIGAIANVLGA
jgi:Dyp-type peroxidase family